MSAKPTHAIPVDGHVHFHRSERVTATLDAAAANFRAIGSSRSACVGALLLTEAAGERVYNHIRERDLAGPWRIEPCAAETQSLICHGTDGWIVVVSGRQIRCERGLEVAALGTTEEFSEGRPLAETILAVTESGALAVLPWGFGKWMGGRGKLVRRMIEHHAPSDFAVGDNGGRLGWLGQPALVRAAAQRGFRVVPGTDPFPFGNDFRRVGAFGFFVDSVPAMNAPWSDLSRGIAAKTGSLPRYGKALDPARFMVNQVGMQFYNFAKRRSAA